MMTHNIRITYVHVHTGGGARGLRGGATGDAVASLECRRAGTPRVSVDMQAPPCVSVDVQASEAGRVRGASFPTDPTQHAQEGREQQGLCTVKGTPPRIDESLSWSRIRGGLWSWCDGSSMAAPPSAHEMCACCCQEWATHALRLMARLATQRPYAQHRWRPQKPLEPSSKSEGESSATSERTRR